MSEVYGTMEHLALVNPEKQEKITQISILRPKTNGGMVTLANKLFL